MLLEQGKLTCGTTWHAAGLVGQTRATRNATRMSRYGIELYSSLEQETGLATGWKQCGSLNVAKTPERLTLMKRQMARAKSFGIEFEFISPAEAGRIAPILRTDDLAGAVWIPGDGKANPTDLTQSLAQGRAHARRDDRRGRQGHRRRHARRPRRRRALEAADDEGDDRLRGDRQLRRPVGARVRPRSPASTCRSTPPSTSTSSPRPIAGVTPDLPVIRDPDGFLYYKEEVGGLVMGGFEPEAKPWNVDPIPDGFEFQLLPEDWDHFEILMQQRDPPHAVPRDRARSSCC